MPFTVKAPEKMGIIGNEHVQWKLPHDIDENFSLKSAYHPAFAWTCQFISDTR